MKHKLLPHISFFIFFTLLFLFPSKAFALTINQSADLVIGQNNFTNADVNKSGSADASTIYAFDGMTASTGGASAYGDYVFVADGGNNRVLIFNTFKSPGGEADLVLGQDNFTDTDFNRGGSADANTLGSPIDVSFDGINLYVADHGNNRILIWHGMPTSNGEPADLVLGQDNFSDTNYNRGGSANANTLNSPVMVRSNGTKLAVADSANSRILIWNTIPTSNGQNANVVVGQDDFVTRQCNMVGASTAFQNKFCEARGVAFYGNKLFVMDSTNNRVLIWNTIPTSNGSNADLVLGQDNFSDRTYNRGTGPAANTMYLPAAAYVRASKLYVSDAGNSRILVWNSIPTSNGAPADIVLGQNDFSGNGSNKGGTADASTLAIPRSVSGTTNHLIVFDVGNNRLLGYLTQFEVDDEEDDDDDDDDKRDKEKCEISRPIQTTWIKSKPMTVNGVKGIYLTWVQYSADKINIKIDDGTESYPWLVEKTLNDGHEFLPNVATSQKIILKPFNKCRAGNESPAFSSQLYPVGYFVN